MKTVGAKIEEADAVISLFQSLPDSFDPLVTALENMAEDDLKLELVKQRLLAEDIKRSERNVEISEIKTTAFSGQKKWKKPVQFNGKCNKCGKRGHYKKDCRQKYTNEANSAEKVDRSVCFMVNCETFSRKSADKIVFKLDSGSSDHLINKKSI